MFLGTSAIAVAQQQAPELDVVATTTERNWNGIAVSNDKRIFADFPRWEKGNNPSLVELKDGKEIAFPGNEWNNWQPGKDPRKAFVSLNSLYINRDDNHLWVTDAGEAFGKDRVPGHPNWLKLIRRYFLPGGSPDLRYVVYAQRKRFEETTLLYF